MAPEDPPRDLAALSRQIESLKASMKHDVEGGLGQLVKKVAGFDLGEFAESVRDLGGTVDMAERWRKCEGLIDDLLKGRPRHVRSIVCSHAGILIHEKDPAVVGGVFAFLVGCVLRGHDLPEQDLRDAASNVSNLTDAEPPEVRQAEPLCRAILLEALERAAGEVEALRRIVDLFHFFGELKPEEALQLRRLVRGADRSVALSAARILVRASRGDDPEALRFLEAVSAEGGPREQVEALDILLEHRPLTQAERGLLEHLTSSGDFELEGRCLDLLLRSARSPEEQASALREARRLLGSPHVEEREACATSLDRFGHESLELASILAAALEAEADPRVREQLLGALGSNQVWSEAIGRLLVRLIEGDRYDSVRAAAVDALWTLHDHDRVTFERERLLAIANARGTAESLAFDLRMALGI